MSVTPATAELSALGATVQLAAEVRDQNGRTMAGTAVTWTSGATAVATVDASGLVTAASNGAVTITAMAGSASGSAAVMVEQAVRSVAVTPAADTLVVGDTLRLEAEATDANGHAVAGAGFAWASSDTSVARVDDTGLVSGVAAGGAAITAAVGEVTGRADLVVTAAPRWTLSGTVSHGWADPESGPSVANPGGRAVGAVVEVVDGPEAGRRATTDDHGRYVLESLEEMQLTVRVAAEGFASIVRMVDLASDTALAFAISRELPPRRPPATFPDTDPEWLRTLSSDYPHAYQVANVRVFSDISPEFSEEHAEHLSRVWDFFDALYAENRGALLDAYYTSDSTVFKKVVPHCPTIFIPGARTVTTCYLDYPRWFVIPYQIPDLGTQLHEIGHDFAFATWPQIEDYPWFKEGTAMYFEGGVFDGSLRIPAPFPWCTILFQRYDREGRLIPLGQLLYIEKDDFLADSLRTYSQSCMLFDYLERHEPGVLYALIHRINSGEIISNDHLVTALLDLAGKSVDELEEAYESHARTAN